MSENAKLNVYKCPSCGGAVKYDAASGRLSCSWCGNEYNSADGLVQESVSSLQGYLCPECGASLMHDDFVVADTCPYCGNNGIAPHRFEGEFKPDFIIPFIVTKAQALEHYKAHLAEMKFLPDDYETEASVLSVQGTYVPFWLRSGEVHFDFTFLCSDGRKEAQYQYFRRAGRYPFTRVPADASERMPDDIMDSIEPYDFNALVPFSPEYLLGFTAERYTVEQGSVDARTDVRVKNSALYAAKGDISSKWKSKNTEKQRSSAIVEYAESEQVLLPVWLIVVIYKGQKYLIGVNGQTGSVAVNLPINEAKQKSHARKLAVRAFGYGVLLVCVPAFFMLIWAIFTNGPGIILQLPQKIVDFVADLITMTGQSDVDIFAKIKGWATIVIPLAILIIAPLLGYGQGLGEAEKAMRNVQAASDSEGYDEGVVIIALSETGKGPIQEENNWPE